MQSLHRSPLARSSQAAYLPLLLSLVDLIQIKKTRGRACPHLPPHTDRNIQREVDNLLFFTCGSSLHCDEVEFLSFFNKDEKEVGVSFFISSSSSLLHQSLPLASLRLHLYIHPDMHISYSTYTSRSPTRSFHHYLYTSISLHFFPSILISVKDSTEDGRPAYRRDEACKWLHECFSLIFRDSE